MKNRIPFALLLALIITQAFGQKSIVKLQVGYGFPLTRSLLSENVQSGTTSSTYTGVYGTYGSGFRIEGGYLRAISEHVSLELDAAYLIGKSINSTYTVQNVTQNQTQEQSTYSHFYEVAPLLRVSLGGNKIKPYAAAGPVAGFGNIVSNFNVSYSGSTGSGTEVTREYTGSFALGAKAAVGAEFTQGRFVFYAQLTMITMSYAPAKSEYTKYRINGVDQLPMLTTFQKQTVYKNSYSSTQNPDPTQPSEQIKTYLPLSSVSLNVGVMFKL